MKLKLDNLLLWFESTATLVHANVDSAGAVAGATVCGVCLSPIWRQLCHKHVHGGEARFLEIIAEAEASKLSLAIPVNVILGH